MMIRFNRRGGYYVLTAVCAAFFAVPVLAQDSTPAPDAEGLTPREREFKEMLTNTKLVGVWQWRSQTEVRKKEQMSMVGQETYTINDVAKANDNYWIITARIQFEGQDLSMPVTVRVVWAEDVATMIVDSTPFPGIGTYSARVMFYAGYYSGIWTGGDHGGVMMGQIVKQEAGEKDQEGDAKDEGSPAADSSAEQD